MRTRFSLICLLLLCSMLAQAQIYRVITPDGRVIYTDTPPEDGEAEEVDLPDIIIQPATEVPNRNSSAESEESRAPQAQQNLPTPTIQRPAEQEVIPPGQREVTVVAQASTPLPSGFVYILLINGNQEGEPSTTPVWTLTNPNPGAQRAQVVIVDEQGSRRVSSEIRTFYVIR